jgi:hypothetical protein
MAGETDLKTLLSTMQPVMHAAAYVFCSVSQEAYQTLSFSPLGIFHEQEGVTLILPEEQARQAELRYDSSWACISLTVHSSLAAVGFLAAITARLAQAGISLNAVSAYYHDHLFVPWENRERAMQILKELGGSSNATR